MLLLGDTWADDVFGSLRAIGALLRNHKET